MVISFILVACTEHRKSFAFPRALDAGPGGLIHQLFLVAKTTLKPMCPTLDEASKHEGPMHICKMERIFQSSIDHVAQSSIGRQKRTIPMLQQNRPDLQVILQRYMEALPPPGQQFTMVSLNNPPVLSAGMLQHDGNHDLLTASLRVEDPWMLQAVETEGFTPPSRMLLRISWSPRRLQAIPASIAPFLDLKQSP